MLNGEIEFKPNSFTSAGRDSAEQTINYRLREGRTAVVYKVNNRGTIPYKTKSMNPAGRGNRTPDLLITNQLRYRLCHSGL